MCLKTNFLLCLPNSWQAAYIKKKKVTGLRHLFLCNGKTPVAKSRRRLSGSMEMKKYLYKYVSIKEGIKGSR